MRTKMKITLLAAVMMLPILGLQAQQRGQNGQGNRQYSERSGIPDLTAEQKEQMQAYRLDVQKSSLPIKNELGENRAKMNTLITAVDPDMKAIDKLIDENAKLMASIMKIKAQNHQKVRSLLTEDQRVVFDTKSVNFARSGQRGNGRKGANGNRGTRGGAK
jgi:Spy/CpxP family protein refolding chaperone